MTDVLIAFEGGEGAGKSTQVRLLADRLTQAGRDVAVTREPGGTQLGRALRRLLLDPSAEGMDPRTEALLYAADRAEHVAAVVRPALARGAVVITDRYVDSSIAYQGAGRGLGTQVVSEVSRWATSGVRANLTVLLDIDPQIGVSRAGRAPADQADRGAASGVPDRVESEPQAFHRRVRQAFLDRASADPGRYLVLDACQTVERIAELVAAAVDQLLEPVGFRSVGAAPGSDAPGRHG
ncbi:MAG: dTMP kinase [Actinomycetes bacterium]